MVYSNISLCFWTLPYYWHTCWEIFVLVYVWMCKPLLLSLKSNHGVSTRLELINLELGHQHDIMWHHTVITPADVHAYESSLNTGILTNQPTKNVWTCLRKSNLRSMILGTPLCCDLISLHPPKLHLLNMQLKDPKSLTKSNMITDLHL